MRVKLDICKFLYDSSNNKQGKSKGNSNRTIQISSSNQVGVVTDVNEGGKGNDIVVFTEFDDITILKQYIYDVYKIPPFKQLLWNRDTKCILGHKIILEGGVQIPYSIEQLLTSPLGSGIPIVDKFYTHRQFIQVKSTPLCKIPKRIGLLNIDDIMTREVTLSSIGNDDNLMNLCYYGFITPYFPMLSYGAFNKYLISGDDIEMEFPDLYPKSIAIRRSIINKLNWNSKPILKVSSVIALAEMHGYGVCSNVLNLRELFDKIELSVLTNRASLSLPGYVRAEKFYGAIDRTSKLAHGMRGSYGRDFESKNGMYGTVSYVLDDRSRESIYEFFNNGKILIYSKYTGYMDYRVVDKCLDDIVDYLRKIYSKTISPKSPKITWKIKHLSLEYIWRIQLDETTFESHINKTLDPFIAAGFIARHEGNIYLLNHRKTSYSSHYNNDFGYLTNATVKLHWRSTFLHKKPIKIVNKFTHIKIKSNRVKITDIRLINAIINHLTSIKIQTKVTTSQVATDKIKGIKGSDPILFTFKENNRDLVVYSRVCQQRYQPNVYPYSDLNKLSEDEKKRMTVFHNFTKNEKALYVCPKKYPYLRLQCKHHPLLLPLPCCKQQKMSNTELYEAMLKDPKHACDISYEINNKKKKRYIIDYSGKQLVEGRRGNLAPQLIKLIDDTKHEFLLYGTKPGSKMSDIRNMIDNAYPDTDYQIFFISDIDIAQSNNPEFIIGKLEPPHMVDKYLALPVIMILYKYKTRNYNFISKKNDNKSGITLIYPDENLHSTLDELLGNNNSNESNNSNENTEKNIHNITIKNIRRFGIDIKSILISNGECYAVINKDNIFISVSRGPFSKGKDEQIVLTNTSTVSNIRKQMGNFVATIKVIKKLSLNITCILKHKNKTVGMRYRTRRNDNFGLILFNDNDISITSIKHSNPWITNIPTLPEVTLMMMTDSNNINKQRLPGKWYQSIDKLHGYDNFKMKVIKYCDNKGIKNNQVRKEVVSIIDKKFLVIKKMLDNLNIHRSDYDKIAKLISKYLVKSIDRSTFKKRLWSLCLNLDMYDYIVSKEIISSLPGSRDHKKALWNDINNPLLKGTVLNPLLIRHHDYLSFTHRENEEIILSGYGLQGGIRRWKIGAGKTIDG